MTGTLCAADGCKRPVGRSGARGWCPQHYYRWRQHGDPLTVHPRGGHRPPVADLFWSKVDRGGPVPPGRPELGGCWRWTAGTRAGYGAFNVPASDAGPRRRVEAHRWAFEQHAGPVPEGHELEHLCHAANGDRRAPAAGPVVPLAGAADQIATAWAADPDRTPPAPTEQQLTEAEAHDNAPHARSNR